MTSPFQSLWFLPFLLYAETHYRFRYFFSLLKKNEPEIIADAPFRLEPNQKLPILIVVKDADLYPCTLKQVSVETRQDQGARNSSQHLEQPIVVHQRFYWFLLHIDVTAYKGWIDVDVTFTIESNGRTTTYRNDNHRTSSKRPLRVYISQDHLPRFPGLHLGDPHTHSSFTDDQVEFGCPMKAARELSRAMGLSFFCVTDHSYDLDDHPDSYLSNDPSLEKWKMFQDEIESLQAEGEGFAVVRGEEVTCRNEDGKNVHLLLFGQREFIHGSGDSAERWLRTRSEHTVAEALGLKSEAAVAYAAHAKESVPILQRLLLGRGMWTDRELGRDGLSGIQIINGMLDDGFRRGYREWIRQLLKGKRLYAIGGNDAHGNFNRFRQIGFPFIAIKEQDHQIFGKMRTGLVLGEQISEHAVLQALKRGSPILTDGPVIRLSAQRPGDERGGISETANEDSLDLELGVISSPEFGEIVSVKIIVGKIGNTSEQTAFRFDGNQGFTLSKQVSVRQTAISYVRVEAFTSKNNPFDTQQHFCFTNPIWTSRDT